MPWSRYLITKDLDKKEEDVVNINNSPKKKSIKSK